jgi:hypothetical protein
MEFYATYNSSSTRFEISTVIIEASFGMIIKEYILERLG